jgi:hypothetical protein
VFIELLSWALCPGPPKWYALKVRAGSFSIDHNLAHYAAINRGTGLVRVASLPLLTRADEVIE